MTECCFPHRKRRTDRKVLRTSLQSVVIRLWRCTTRYTDDTCHTINRFRLFSLPLANHGVARFSGHRTYTDCVFQPSAGLARKNTNGPWKQQDCQTSYLYFTSIHRDGIKTHVHAQTSIMVATVFCRESLKNKNNVIILQKFKRYLIFYNKEK